MKFIQSLLSVLLGAITLVSAQPGGSESLLVEVAAENGLTMFGAGANITGQITALTGDDELSK
jgi:hypothetical protein